MHSSKKKKKEKKKRISMHIGDAPSLLQEISWSL